MTRIGLWAGIASCWIGGILGVGIAPPTPVAALDFFVQPDLDPLDQAIYQPLGVTNANAARKELMRQLEGEVLIIIQRFSQSGLELSATQKEQLRLAGRGDVERFINRNTRAKASFLAEHPDGVQKVGDADPDVLKDYLRLLTESHASLDRGLFGDVSLLHKVTFAMTPPKQREALEAERESQRRAAAQRALRFYLASLQKNIPFTAAQSDSLYEAMIEPMKNAFLRTTNEHPPLDKFVAPYLISQLPDATIRDILGDDLFTPFRKLTDPAMQYRAKLNEGGWLP